MRAFPHTLFPYFATIAVVLSSCQQEKGGVPCVDAQKNYPTKEIFLNEIADVTYLHIYSGNNEYLYDGNIVSLTENTIVIAEGGRGNILFFHQDGTPKLRFNRLGNGPGEYRSAHRVLYDEESDEVFVINSTYIQVYSSSGWYKRTINLPEGTRINNDVVFFDDQYIFFYDAGVEFRKALEEDYLTEINIAPYYLMSKVDGVILDYLELPIAPLFLGIHIDGMRLPARYKNRLMKSKEGVLLCNPENDTVFLYGKDKSLTPVLHKIPPAGSTNPVTYMNNCIDTDNYQFTEVYEVRRGDTYPGVFPVKYYMRYKETGEVFHPKFLLSDYKGEEFIISPSTFRTSYENGYVIELDLIKLKQAYRENRLSGKLKELVATLKEDDNNVFVLAQFK